MQGDERPVRRETSRRTSRRPRPDSAESGPRQPSGSSRRSRRPAPQTRPSVESRRRPRHNLRRHLTPITQPNTADDWYATHGPVGQRDLDNQRLATSSGQHGTAKRPVPRHRWVPRQSRVQPTPGLIESRLTARLTTRRQRRDRVAVDLSRGRLRKRTAQTQEQDENPGKLRHGATVSRRQLPGVT